MSQISKCPKVMLVLTYWEASGDVSELRYKSLLYLIISVPNDHTVVGLRNIEMAMKFDMQLL